MQNNVSITIGGFIFRNYSLPTPDEHEVIKITKYKGK